MARRQPTRILDSLLTPGDGAYRGYSWRLDRTSDLYYISKGGFHISTEISLDAVKATIDMLVS